jgi:hypothetical protein
MAAAGLTENSRMSIGVISAPPPAPVSPTSNPTTALPEDDIQAQAHPVAPFVDVPTRWPNATFPTT